MIRTFRGQGRVLGAGEERQFELAIEAELRNHLHLFKGSSLNVFICIALHIDDFGWSFPTVPTIMRETKRNEATVHRALNHLVQMEIDGARLLLRVKQPPRHIDPEKVKSKRPRNFYLVFPNKAELARYGEGTPKRGKGNQKCTLKNDSSQKCTVNFDRQRITNKKESPDKGFKETPTPTSARAGAAADAERQPAAGRSIYEWEIVEAWARDSAQKDPTIRSARAVAIAAYKSGTSDLFIQIWLAEQEASPSGSTPAGGAAERSESECPDCHGTGMFYPEGFDKGVAKCTHAKLKTGE